MIAMPERPRSHFNYDDRCAIEEGVRDGLSASAIARRLDVSPSSVTREVKSNRWAREPKRRSVRQARKCGAYNDCRKKRSVCAQCLLAETKRHSCKLCPAVVCCDLCPDFVPRECPAVTRWPYVCACAQSKKSACDLPKFRYDARRAQEMADARRSESREGVSITEEELARMLDIVVPLIENGLSPEAVWMSNPDLPVGCRTFRSWMESGIVPIPAIALPRKVRYRPRKKKHGPAAARPGREYADFLALSQEERDSAVEVDSVIGYAGNQARILSFHAVRAVFQFYLRLEGPGSAPVVEACDMLERLLGDPSCSGRHLASWLSIEARSSPTGRELSAAALLREQPGAMFTTAIPCGLAKRAIASATMQSSGASCRRAAATSMRLQVETFPLPPATYPLIRGPALAAKDPSTWQPPCFRKDSSMPWESRRYP